MMNNINDLILYFSVIGNYVRGTRQESGNVSCFANAWSHVQVCIFYVVLICIIISKLISKLIKGTNFFDIF